MTVSVFEMFAGGRYFGEAGGQLLTDLIVMNGGSSVSGVLQNTTLLRYQGGSFIDGAGLRNEGRVDLNAPALVGFIENSGTIAVPTGRSLSVMRSAAPSPWGGGTGVVVNRGSLTNAGAVDEGNIAEVYQYLRVLAQQRHDGVTELLHVGGIDVVH